MNLSYSFPVVKGVQAGKEYYIGMIPLNMLSKLFIEDYEYVLPEYRAQRKLNENRIPEIKRYILENKDSYVFSALTASIDGEFKYIPSNNESVGVLEISLDSRFLINDGQHRKAAILAALEEDESIGSETISVVFFGDKGLNRSQQMFTDLNKHAVKTSNSISELYDSRDDFAVITRNVVSKIEFLNTYTDKEKDILGKYSSSLFTLNSFYSANKTIVGRADPNCYESFITEYWSLVAKHMCPWNELMRHEVSKVDLREKYIATQNVVIQAFGRVGNCLKDNNGGVEKYISKIETIDWSRSASIWRMRAVGKTGRILTNKLAVVLIANVIKQAMGLPLSSEEKQAEKEIEN